MKKLFTILTFCIFISIQSFAQEVINSYANQTGTWSNYTNSWIWNQSKYVKINFLIQNNVIIASDDAQSTYTTLRISYEDESSVCWDAIDEQGRSCTVILSLNRENKCLMIMYSNLCFRYYY